MKIYTIRAAKCLRLVNLFKRFVNVNIELEWRHIHMGIVTNQPTIDCPAKWNSTYDMFERLLEERLAISQDFSSECAMKIYFFYFSTKTYVVGTQKNRLDMTVLLSTQNIC